MSLIILNGCSSAGKSSIARRLQDSLEEPHLLIGIDHFFPMVPRRMFPMPGRTHEVSEGFYFEKSVGGGEQLRCGSFGRKTIAAYHQAVAAIARMGVGLIVDDVVLDDEMRLDWLGALRDVEGYLVGVHCALDELERRERARGNRMVGAARVQFDQVHSKMIYDVEVDTSTNDADSCAEEICRALERRKKPSALARMRDLLPRQ